MKIHGFVAVHLQLLSRLSLTKVVRAHISSRLWGVDLSLTLIFVVWSQVAHIELRDMLTTTMSSTGKDLLRGACQRIGELMAITISHIENIATGKDDRRLEEVE